MPQREDHSTRISDDAHSVAPLAENRQSSPLALRYFRYGKTPNGDGLPKPVA